MQLTHFGFADDIQVFTYGRTDSLDGVLAIINQFAEMSGLHINASKSSILAAGQKTARRD